MKKTLIDIVASSSRARTLSAEIDRRMKHPKYGKIILGRGVCISDDEDGTAKALSVAIDRKIKHSKYGKIVRDLTACEVYVEDGKVKKVDIVEILPNWRLRPVRRRSHLVDLVTVDTVRTIVHRIRRSTADATDTFQEDKNIQYDAFKIAASAHSHILRTPEFTAIVDANHLVSVGQRNAGMDALHELFDELMRERRFESLQNLLLSLPYHKLETDVLLGILTATLPVRSKVASRQKAVVETARLVRLRNEWEDGLLDGLEQ